MPFIVRMSRQKLSWHGEGTFHDAYRSRHACHWVQSWTDFVSCSWTGSTLIWCHWPGTDEYWMCGLSFSRWYFSILSHSKRIHSLWMNACIQTTSPYDEVKFFSLQRKRSLRSVLSSAIGWTVKGGFETGTTSKEPKGTIAGKVDAYHTNITVFIAVRF